MRTALKLLLVLMSVNSFAQTKEQKIYEILKMTGTIDGYKYYIFDMTIKPLKYNLDKDDSLKLNSIEKKLTDGVIAQRLSKGYSEVFTEKEINEIYSFYKSSAGAKILSSNDSLEKKYTESFRDIQNELQPIIDKINKISTEAENNKEIPIPVDKEDGFYSVVYYNVQNDRLKDLKLAAKPTVSTKEVLEIKKLKNDLDQNVIDIVLNRAGAKKIKILTENNIGKPVAIVLNKKLISAPTVISVIPNGRIQISGNLSDEEINEIINTLKK
ncbi:DUF2059 domain-containing protein [Chryseobacterium sp.]|uniref:DUF2059 domain-containing protein n=1 Tax=Chryseobacterium sp. TaxID=1871047 RepID=UPI0011C75F87|nr:DUF2059 domain-containing protein [Chryseobacterium sp.]TXF74880.1 DUF2059 domain-containing protein [Chryseobacterium sp.]